MELRLPAERHRDALCRHVRPMSKTLLSATGQIPELKQRDYPVPLPASSCLNRNPSKRQKSEESHEL